MQVNPYQKNVWIGKSIGYTTLLILGVVLFFFLVLPVSVVLVKAFYTDTGIGLDYFVLLFNNDLQVKGIWNSLKIGLATTFFSILISLPLTIINSRFQFKGKVLLSGLILVPMIMPPFVGAIGFQKFFSQYGSVNLLLMSWFGMEPINWTAQEFKFWLVVILEVLHLYPIMYLNLSAAVANVDPSLEEAAVIAGANPIKRFMHVTWPLAAPGVFAGSMIVFVWALTDLGTPLLVGYHECMPVSIFNLVTDINENPIGYALVSLVILLTVSIFLSSKMIFGRKKYDMMARGHVQSMIRPASRWQLAWIYPTFGLILFLALLPHISVILTSIGERWFMTPFPESYTLEYYHLVFSSELPITGLKNSILFSGVSTVVDLVLGVAIAYVISRKLIPMTSLLDALVMIPLALPGIVIAFGYIMTFSGTFLDPFDNPIALLIIAYAIRRLPFMVRAAMAGMQQTGVSLEEAAYTFGASRFESLKKIVVPLIAANLIAGGMLCFAYAMLDVSDSLILAMKAQFFPLTKAIYSLFLEQGTGELVASALGVIGMMILAFCIIVASMILGKRMGELFRT